jgi:thiamine biosynthesis lipoprotein
MMRRAQPWLGTMVDITIGDALDEAHLHAAFDAAFAAVARVHRLMSFHEPSSDVSRVNRAGVGVSVDVDASTAEVIRCALDLARQSGGIFDIACADRLVEWGYLPSPGKLPTHASSIDMIVPGEDGRMAKRREGWIDLGGIAKGYAVDAAVAALQTKGVQSACVNAGGDLRVLGDVPFDISVRNPRDPVAMALSIPIRNGALATSGAYFSRQHIDGELRSALIDGRNAAALTDEFSVSVEAPTCMIADALTKVVAATRDREHPLLARYEARARII